MVNIVVLHCFTAVDIQVPSLGFLVLGFSTDLMTQLSLRLVL